MTLENGVLRAKLGELGEKAAFTVTATDARGLSTELPVEFPVSFPEKKIDRVSDAQEYGRFGEDYWELDLKELFGDPEGCGLVYTLSDDCGGAATLENGVLQLRPRGQQSVSLTVTATDARGLSAELPVEIGIPAPAAKSEGISDTVRTGLFQQGVWERKVGDLFEDSKGTGLDYSLTDDYAGKLKIEDDTLRADCKGLGEAEFSVKATDPFGLSAEVPFRLVEKNMTWTILGIALAAILLVVLLYLGMRKARTKSRKP